MYIHLPSMIHPISYENSYSFIETTRLNLNLHAPFMNWSKSTAAKTDKKMTGQISARPVYRLFQTYSDLK